VKAFEDSEWQGHTFSGSILMPLATLRLVARPTVASLATIYNVSEPFVRSRLKRLKVEVPQW
jgi:Zn-dependent peptidase ImmA (M78 family)